MNDFFNVTRSINRSYKILFRDVIQICVYDHATLDTLYHIHHISYLVMLKTDKFKLKNIF